MRNQVIGNYRIIEAIGEGGMGKVFRGVDLMLEREVAIKVIRSEYSRRPDFMERFRTEAKALARLSHPNIVTVYAFFQHRTHLLMVMEFVHGEALSARIARQPTMPWTQALPLFRQVLAGVEHAHSKGIIHRDIKPGNLIITATGLVKVMDFGIARMVNTAPATLHGDRAGTLTYMSPEQIQGQPADARSDIYSLGLVLYKMLTGRAPFVQQNPDALLRAQVEETPAPLGRLSPAAPAELEAIIRRALAKAPERRMQTVGELRRALEKMLRDPATVTARPPPEPWTDAPPAPSTAAFGRPTLSTGRSAADGLAPEADNPSWLAAGTAVDRSLTSTIFVEPDPWPPVCDPPSKESAESGIASIAEAATAATAFIPRPIVLTSATHLMRPAKAQPAKFARGFRKRLWEISAAFGLGMAVALCAWQYRYASEKLTSPPAAAAVQRPASQELAQQPGAAYAGEGEVQWPASQEIAQTLLELPALPPAPAKAPVEPPAKPAWRSPAAPPLTPPRAEKSLRPVQMVKHRAIERPAVKRVSKPVKESRKPVLLRPTAPVNTARELILSMFPWED